MSAPLARRKVLESARHRTSYLEAGPEGGPLLVFVHGWPCLGSIWRSQITHFAAAGYRCFAPDMRGYGGSSVPATASAYAVRELVTDMTELHDALGGKPAVWIGHDWGSAVAWSMAAHHAERCRGVVSLCMPYLARGLALPTLLPLIEREMYPVEAYPVGQWDYWLFYREHFARAAQDFEADVEATLALLFRAAAPPSPGAPTRRAPLADVRARGGWFGEARRAPKMPRDESMMSQEDFDEMVAAFGVTGFRGGNAWYLNDAANLAYASEAPQFGRLTMPALFLHATGDVVCETERSQLAEPMRDDCVDLHEERIACGHSMMLEKPHEVNEALAAWLRAKELARSSVEEQ